MNKLYRYLPYAGTLPFIACTVCLCAGIGQLPMLGSVQTLLSVYGLVIAVFMAGAHWGQHLPMQQGGLASTLAIISNVVALSLWLGYIFLGFGMLVVLLVATFLLLLLVDYRLALAQVISQPYWHTRLGVTAIVIVSLIVAGITL